MLMIAKSAQKHSPKNRRKIKVLEPQPIRIDGNTCPEEKDNQNPESDKYFFLHNWSPLM
jgi:hypothetical protein